MTSPIIDDPSLCIVHTRAGERPSPVLAALLDPVDPGSFHAYVLPPERIIKLHYHDYDEYWWFTSGEPIVTLWAEATGAREYRLGPGDLVATVRGVGHTLRADHPVAYYQFFSVRRPGAREGKLPVDLTGGG